MEASVIARKHSSCYQCCACSIGGAADRVAGADSAHPDVEIISPDPVRRFGVPVLRGTWPRYRAHGFDPARLTPCAGAGAAGSVQQQVMSFKIQSCEHLLTRTHLRPGHAKQLQTLCKCALRVLVTVCLSLSSVCVNCRCLPCNAIQCSCTTCRVRSRALLTVHGSLAAVQPAASKQPTATRQQQHARVTLHKNRRQKSPMQVPSEEAPPQVPSALAQYAGCR